jgi:hypothetical protein
MAPVAMRADDVEQFAAGGVAAALADHGALHGVAPHGLARSAGSTMSGQPRRAVARNLKHSPKSRPHPL